MVASGVIFVAITSRRLVEWIIVEMNYPEMVRKGEYRGLEWAIFMNHFLFVFLGTLIWGYGDIVVCWINGKGWNPC